MALQQKTPLSPTQFTSVGWRENWQYKSLKLWICKKSNHKGSTDEEIRTLTQANSESATEPCLKQMNEILT